MKTIKDCLRLWEQVDMEWIDPMEKSKYHEVLDHVLTQDERNIWEKIISDSRKDNVEGFNGMIRLGNYRRYILMYCVKMNSEAKETLSDLINLCH